MMYGIQLVDLGDVLLVGLGRRPERRDISCRPERSDFKVVMRDMIK